MSTPNLPPQEPLDAQEREFARILRALPGGEPPAPLDAAILRAATNAAASSRKPVRRLLASAGALWGIGSAAAAVLALGVAWQMRYGSDNHGVIESSAPRPHAVSDREEDEAVPVEFSDQAAAAPAVAAAPPPPMMSKPAQPARMQSPRGYANNAPTPMAAAAPAPEPYPADHLDEHVSRAQAQANAAEAANLASADAAQASETTGSAQAAKAMEEDRRDAVAAKAAPAPPGVAAEPKAGVASGGAASGVLDRTTATREATTMKPATWLAEVRRLRDAGQIELARAKLVEFRRAYPNWVIPTDLAPLLSE